MRIKRRPVLRSRLNSPFLPVVFALLAGLQAATVAAATLHHWRFEDSPGFLADSAGSADLTATGITQQTALAATGRGMYFTGLPGGNASAAEVEPGAIGFLGATIPAMTGNFTAEAFVHFDQLAGQWGAHIMGPTSDGTVWSWTLQVRFNGWAGSMGKELILGLQDGSLTAEVIRSFIIMETGKDYYVAAALNLSGGEATLYVQNLTDAGPLQIVTGSHSRTSLLPVTSFSIGGFFNSDAPMDGLVDEVRISDTLLTPEDLLIANLGPPVDPVPEPSLLVLLVTGSLALACIRRKRTA